MTDRAHELLDFWFGDLGHADLPSSDRTQLWFGENEELKLVLLKNYLEDFKKASEKKLTAWEKTPRGRLALILLLDQFPRSYYRHSPQAFSFDTEAQKLCLAGLEKNTDHALTLIERVFFYMPLVHSENELHQEKSINLFQQLVGLSMPETTQVYQLFLAYSYAHFRVIKEFGRFPQRNIILGRQPSDEEIAFLKSS